MHTYEAAWAYLQGALEALTPLVVDLSPAKLKERLEETIRVGRGLSVMAQMPQPDMITGDDPNHKSGLDKLAEVAGLATPNSSSVFFPHDLQRSGNGTFTPPEPTEEEIEELLRRRNGE